MWGKRGRRPAWRLLGATLAVAAVALPAATPVGGSTACPCSLFGGFPEPELTGQTDPHPVELGLKFAVDAPVRLTKIRFYKDAAETGSHVGRIWAADGTELAQASFGSESAVGWQETALATPVLLATGSTYTVSVGFNEAFVITQDALGSVVSNGPLRTIADGANGVYNVTAGARPVDSYRDSNYFIDVVVEELEPPTATLSPVDASVGVAVAAAPSAVFSRAMDGATITDSSFTLEGPGGAVPASVAYDPATRTATLTPSASLAHATTYTARLATSITADDGVVLDAAVSWTFTTAAAPAPPAPAPAPASPPTAPAAAPDPHADVSLSIGSLPGAATVGTDVTYTLTASNRGPASATGVTVASDLPVGLALRSARGAQGGCTAGATVRCSIGTLAPGQSTQITISAAAITTGETTIASVVGAQQPDPNTVNNRTTVTLAVAERLVPLTEASVRVSGVRTRLTTRSTAAAARTWLTIDASAMPFRPSRLQLATDPATPWSWRSFVERFSFRSRLPEIWIRLSDGNGTVTEWQRVRFPRSVPAGSRR